MSFDLAGYQKWLTKQQREPVFINNFWCALLATDMEESKLAESFKIPYFIVEEEITKEDNNFIQNNDNAYISNPLRHWLIHLLKPYNANVNILNYEEVLRVFFETKSFPTNVVCPLSSRTSFHNLPSECKIWILYTLRRYANSASMPRAVTKDHAGNEYYIVPDCRIYVRLAISEKYYRPIDEARARGQPWETLYRYIRSYPCLLLCENQNEWDTILDAFKSFGMPNLQFSILPEMVLRMSGQNQVMAMRGDQRRRFGETMNMLIPIPKARRLRNLENKDILESAGEKTADALQSYNGAGNLKETVLPVIEAVIPPTTLKEAKQNKKSREILGRCWNFPQCPLQYRCKYVHPKNPCTKFPNCPRGWECLFLHEFCPNDDDCVEPNCAYEHLNSMSTYYRIPREAETTTPRPIASVPPTVRADKAVSNTPETSPNTVKTPATVQVIVKEKKRCQYFPQCGLGENCRYIHPSQKCRKLAAGVKCPGRWCLSLHGTCPNDGACDDGKCVYEHEKSLPIILRKQSGQKKNGTLSRTTSIANLSRANSESNLSTISTRSRRKSVSFDVDSNGELIEYSAIKKESTASQPVGILRPFGMNSIGRCRFGPRCTNKECKYTHPTGKCKAFPECPKGGACLFLHETCENDGVCSKESCDFEHYQAYEMDNSWCNNGSLCKRANCKFLHPKECVAPCPTPGECWMHHRPGSRPTPAQQTSMPRPSPAHQPAQTNPTPQPALHHPNHPDQAPGHGPQYPQGAGFNGSYGPGYGQAPPFGYQGGFQYGHNHNYGPAYPPGQGYGQAPGLGPGGYYGPPPPNFGPGPGYWPGQVPQHGGYAPHPGYDPRPVYPGTGAGYPQGARGYDQRPYDGPPHPSDHASPAPPPYPNTTAEERREFIERKDRISEDRFRGDDYTRL